MSDDGKRQLSQVELAQRRSAALTHGLASAFVEHDAPETTLTESQRGRLVELRAELQTSAGVIDALRERAARVVLIAEWGEAWLQDKAEKEGGIAAFEAKMLQRFFTAQAEARRSLEVLIRAVGKGDGGINADDVLKAIRDDK